MEWCVLCLDSHSDGTHSLQRIHWWASDVMLHFRCLAQGHLSRGIEGEESSWGFGALLKGTSVVVLKVKRAVGGSVPCSRAPRSWYWRWREQLGVRWLAQGHLSRGIEGGESSWGFGVLLKSTSVVVLKVERAVGGSVPCSRAPRSWYWRWREQLGVRCLAQGHLSRGIEGGESSWGFGALLKGTSVVVLKVERALYIHSAPPPHLQFLPAWDSNPQPFDYKSNSLPLNHDFHEPQTVPLSGNIVNKTNLFSFKFAWMHLKQFLNWVTDIRVGPEIVTDPAFLVTRLVMETLSTFFLMPAEEKKTFEIMNFIRIWGNWNVKLVFNTLTGVWKTLSHGWIHPRSNNMSWTTTRRYVEVYFFTRWKRLFYDSLTWSRSLL